MEIVRHKMFNKSPSTMETIKDLTELFGAMNDRQSKNTDLTFQTTMRFLTLMEVLVEKRIITPDESTRIMNEGKDG
jgi:hypothetical protein